MAFSTKAVSIPQSAALLAGTAVLAVMLSASPATAAIYYVDAQGGSDSADGLSPATAWKSGPGDSRSTGKSRSIVLQPGDIVRFKGGVRYRGTMTPNARGTVDKPIIFEGSAFGDKRAIIDGSDPVAGVRRCTSAADCFDNPNWQHLYRFPIAPDMRWTDWIFANDIAMQAGQWPDAGKLEVDNLAKFLTIARAQLAQLQAGSISHALPPGLSKGSPVLGLWVIPNYVAYTTSPISVTASGVSFAGSQWVNGSLKPYTDRDNKFTIMNAPDAVTRPGTFAMSPKDGYAILWPMHQRAPAVSIGGRRMGLNLSLASNVIVRGFSFANFAGSKESYGTGMAIYSHNAPENIQIINNNIRAVVNVANNGPAISMLKAKNLRVEGNVMTDMLWTSAMQIDNTAGPVLIKCNSITDIGKTAIRFQNVKDGTIQGNYIARVNGIHGNGITTYGDSRNVRVLDNVAVASQRPMTTHGVTQAYHDSGTPAVVVERNVFVGTLNSMGALTSYGLTDGLKLLDNIIAGPNFSLSIAGTERNFSSARNRFIGTVRVNNKAPLVDMAANLQFDPSGNGAILREEAARARVAAGVCA